MNKLIVSSLVLLTSLSAIAADSAHEVPEPFRGHDPNSTYRIAYSDLDTLFKAAVIDVGRSTRKKVAPETAPTGTHMKSGPKRSTSYEGNRFRFEEFADKPELRALLGQIRTNLEAIPDQAPLDLFSRDEQLAYWLNLYNVTLLDEIVAVYPQRSLKKFLTGGNSVPARKILRVAGVDLSLDDIQHVILKKNYSNDPLLMYGLYQGIIGGPNIRRHAYSGDKVYRQLADNAAEFINSNRGTEKSRRGVFRVSSLYQRNAAYFPDFDTELGQHLMAYIEGAERDALQSATRIKPGIDDWAITDLYGSHRNTGASFATNKAALLNAVQATTMVDGQIIPTNFSDPSGVITDKAPADARFSPELVAHLNEIRLREEAAFIEKGGTVTVEELGQAPDAEQDGRDPDENR